MLGRKRRRLTYVWMVEDLHHTDLPEELRDTNFSHRFVGMRLFGTDGQIHRQTETDRQTDRQTEGHRQVDRRTDG